MSAVGEAFLIFEQASEEEDPTAALALFRDVLARQRELGGDIELDERVLPLDVTLCNIAALSHALGDWTAMRDAAAEARSLAPFHAAAHTMYSIAIKQLGDREGAAQALERALAVGPEEVAPVHELACQRLAAGDRAGALDAIAQAMQRGADPEALREDAELASLLGDPRWEELTDREHYIACLLALLAAEHADLPEADADDAWLEEDDTLDAFAEAEDLADRILEAADLEDVPSLPVDPDGFELIDISACDETQTQAIAALIAAERFWQSLTYVFILQQHRLPSVSPEDARERLGL